MAPSEYESECSNVFVLLRQNLGRVACGGERIEKNTNGVRCKALTVENNIGKNM